MKIALVVHDFDPRFGQGRYAVELAHRFAANHDVHVYANTFAPVLAPNITYQRVSAWRATALTTIVSFVRNAEALLARRDYDIIHAQGLTCWNADVITAHICNMARFEQTQARDLKAQIFPVIINQLEARFYQQELARCVIGVSRKVEQEIRDLYDWSRLSRTIYHGFDVGAYSARAPAGARWRWLFVGEATKGLAQVIQQLPAFPEARLRVISRSAPDTYLTLAESLGVTPQLDWHGPTNDVVAEYRAADVFVYPSDYDAFGMVVAEAMAEGLPVIVGTGAGATEWIEHGTNGLLVEPSEKESLRQALSRLRGDSELAIRLGESARKTVAEHTWDRCATETLAVYEEVLHSRS